MARYVVVLGPSHGPLLFHTEYRILPSLYVYIYIYTIPLTQSNMFWQRHEFAVFSKETTIGGRSYIPSRSQFQTFSLLLLFLPSSLIPGRIKVFETKLHRESSIHARMFFLFFPPTSLSPPFLSPLVNYLSLFSHVLLCLVARCYTFRA